MSRVQLSEVILATNANLTVSVPASGSVTVYERGGTALATIYSAVSGGTALPNPRPVTNGYATGYIDTGSYDLVASANGQTGDRVEWEALRGDSVVSDTEAPWTGMDSGYTSKRNGLRRAVYVADYIDGTESATVQAAGINQAVTDMVARGLKELRFGPPPDEGETRWEINNRIWTPREAAGARILGEGAEILRSDWIVAGTSNGLHFDQHSDAEGVVYDDFTLSHETAMTYTTAFPGSWRGSNHYLKGAGIFVCANGTKATRIKGYGRSTLVFVNDYVSHADGTDTDTADRTGTVENFHVEDIEGIDPATGNPCNNVTLVEGATRGGFIGKHRGTHADPSGVTETDAFPGHLIYVSGSAGDHKGLTGGDWEAVGGRGRGANHAFSLKGIESGALSKLIARDCEGLMTVQEGGKGLSISDAVAHGDICESGEGATVEVKLSSEQVQVDGLQINRATAGQALVVDGPKNTIRNVKITLDDVSTSTDVIAFNSSGDGSRILGVDFENLDTVGCPAAAINNNCANAHIEFKRAVNVTRLCNLGSGTDGSSVSYDPATVTLMTAAGATDDALGNPAGYAVVSSSGTAIRSSQRSRRRVFTVTTGAHYPYWNPSLEDEVFVQCTGNGSVNVSNFPAGDSPTLFNGKRLRLVISNESGGTMGAIAFASDFTLSGPTPNRPTTGNQLVMHFEYRAGGAYELPNSREYSNLASELVVATDAVGNANGAITPTSMRYTITQATTLTADRARTLATTGMQPGATVRVVRTSAGAFNLNVGTGPLKAMAASTWADFVYDGSAWALAAAGSL